MKRHFINISKWVLALIIILTITVSFVPTLKVLAYDLYESYTPPSWTFASYLLDAQSDSLVGQTFTPSTSHYITSIKVYLYRDSGLTGSVYCYLYSTVGGLPNTQLSSMSISSSTITTSTSGAWYTFTLSSPIALTAGTKYAIVINPTVHSVDYKLYYTYQSAGSYTGGTVVWYYTDGADYYWGAQSSWDMLFQEYGYAITIPTVTTQAASDVGSTTATGNGNITSLNYGTVTKRGIAYSTTDTTPTIAEGASYVEETSASFSTGAFTENLTGLTKNTTYYCAAYAYNSAGYGYGSTVSFTTLVTAPSISSVAANNISKTSAQLNSVVNDDGGMDCEVRFGYGTTSQTSANFTSYDTVTSWVGGYNTSETPYVSISSLTASTEYYFRVQIKNDDSTVTSNELSFTTSSTVSAVTNFKATPNIDNVYLSWVKGAGASKTLIRYSYDTYPTSTSEGVELYSGVASDYTHTGLNSGTTIFYTAWAFDGATYSTAVYLMITTNAGVITTTSTEDIMSSSYWYQSPNYTNLSGIEPLYTIINGLADDYDMPYATAWVLFALAICTIAGVGTWLTSGSGLAGGAVMTVTLGCGVGIGLLQFWMVFFGLLFIIPAIINRRDYGGGI